MDLKGKVVVITGSTKGLGRALAQSFMAEGSQVVINARDAAEVKAAAGELNVLGIAGDVAKENDVAALAQGALDKYGRIDVWVNNAGVSVKHGPIEDLDMEKVHDMFEVNVFGLMYGSRQAMKVMKQQQSGLILNIVSMSSQVGRPLSAGYSASKWAARGFTESLRLALKPFHISVIAVHPGGIKTSIFGDFKPEGYDTWMEPSFVAGEIVKNLKLDSPQEELIVNTIK